MTEKQPFGVVLKPQFDIEKLKVGMPILMKKDSMALSRSAYCYDSILKNLEIKTYGLVSKVGPLTLEVCCVTAEGDSQYVEIPVKYVADGVLEIKLIVNTDD